MNFSHTEIFLRFVNTPLKERENELIFSCQYGDMRTIKYLLTAPNKELRVAVNCRSDAAIRFACKYGMVDVARYLLTSPDLTQHADIHALEDNAFALACEYNQEEMISFLIAEMKLPRTKAINAFLKKHPYPFASSLFLATELARTLPDQKKTTTTGRTKL